MFKVFKKYIVGYMYMFLCYIFDVLIFKLLKFIYIDGNILFLA